MIQDLIFSVFILLVIGGVGLIIYSIENGNPFSEVGKARRARKSRWERYYIEYLTYGYGEYDAKTKANHKMDKEAADADSVKV